MILTLIRQPSTAKGTPGTLLIDGMPFCNTLEPPYGWASGPAYNGGKNTLTPETAPKGRIPDGTYRVSLTYSPKFKRVMPLVDIVTGFEGIRIHPGNTIRDTRGCLLVGRACSTTCLQNLNEIGKTVGCYASPTRLTDVKSRVDPENACSLVSLTDSRATFLELMEKLTPVQAAREEIWLEIGDAEYIEALHRREDDLEPEEEELE